MCSKENPKKFGSLATESFDDMGGLSFNVADLGSLINFIHSKTAKDPNGDNVDPGAASREDKSNNAGLNTGDMITTPGTISMGDDSNPYGLKGFGLVIDITSKGMTGRFGQGGYDIGADLYSMAKGVSNIYKADAQRRANEEQDKAELQKAKAALLEKAIEARNKGGAGSAEFLEALALAAGSQTNGEVHVAYASGGSSGVGGFGIGYENVDSSTGSGGNQNLGQLSDEDLRAVLMASREDELIGQLGSQRAMASITKPIPGTAENPFTEWQNFIDGEVQFGKNLITLGFEKEVTNPITGDAVHPQLGP